MENTTVTQDRLVLYLEEVCDGEVDTRCYVLYDEIEREYFVCGSRLDSDSVRYGEFKFYCKSKRDLLHYLEFVLNVEHGSLTFGLYNYADLFYNHEVVDYNVLEEGRTLLNEITMYLDMTYDYKQIKRLLKMLKSLRY
jgi:hypothetical protein